MPSLDMRPTTLKLNNAEKYQGIYFKWLVYLCIIFDSVELISIIEKLHEYLDDIKILISSLMDCI